MFKTLINNGKEFANKSTVNLVLIIVLILITVYFLGSQLSKLYKYLKASYLGSASELTDEQADTIVNKLLLAFDNLLTPFNTTEIIEALQGLTTADYYKVKARFGHKNRGFVLGDVFKGLGSSLLAESLDLNQWLVKELGDDIELLKESNPNLPI